MDDHEHREEVVARLARIEGHVRGISRMLTEGQPCDAVLVQMAAVKAALNKATKILLEDHYEHCILQKNTDRSLDKDLADFKKILEGFLS